MNILSKISQREKKFLFVGGLIVIIIIIYNLSAWYRDFRITTKEHLEAKQLTLEKQLKKISEKKDIQEKLETVSSDLKKLEDGLLPGDKPPVAAADIQRILKKMASSLNIDIKLERTLTPVESRLYTGIPVEIGFIASTEKLKDMIYKIKTSSPLLTISAMKIRVTNIKNPVDIYTTLTVRGFIKKSPTRNNGQKEGKDVS